MPAGNFRLPDLKAMNEGLFEPLLSLGKLFIAAAMVSGSIYLLVYCASNNIPVPVSLAELPTLLVAMFGVGSFLAMTIFVAALIPYFTRVTNLLETFPRLFAMRRTRRVAASARPIRLLKDRYRNLSRKIMWRNIIIYSGCIALPIAEIFSYIFLINAVDPNSDCEAFVLYLITPILLGLMYGSTFSAILSKWSRTNRTITRSRMAMDIGALIVIAFFWVSFIFFIVLNKALHQKYPDWALGSIYFVSPILLLALFYMLMVPKAFTPGPSLKGIVLGSLALIAMTPVFPVVSPWISGAALRSLHLGGNYGAKLRLNDTGNEPLPKEFLDNLKAENSNVIPVHVVLNLGDYVYVRRPDDGGYPVAIPRTDIESEEIIY